MAHSSSGYGLTEALPKSRCTPDRKNPADYQFLPGKRLDFSQLEIVERRGDEKNSDQPCFPVPDIPPRRFRGHPTNIESKRLFHFAHTRSLAV
jgi:hypothetical protein